MRELREFKSCAARIAEEIDALVAELAPEIGAAMIQGEGDKATRLTGLVTKIKKEKADLAALASSFAMTVADIDRARQTITRGDPTKLKLTIRWNLLPFATHRPETIICEPIAAKTLGLFFEQLVGVFGPSVLGRISQMPVTRQRLLSQYPSQDFVNGNTHEEYPSRKIGDTTWYVVTQSSTEEKAERILEVCNFLHFPSGVVTVDILPR